jgi:ribonucleoside-diphosphate reductase alpha subunit
MKVRNREGQSLDISYDEIKTRITRLCSRDELASVDVDKVVIQTINGIYDGITTWELDDLSARICASLQSVHYAYDAIAAKIAVSNLAKSVRRRLHEVAGLPCTFSSKMRFMSRHASVRLRPDFLRFVERHGDLLDAMPNYERDTSHSYFALRTMERSYLMRADDGLCIESPQDMWLRVSIAIHMPDVDCDNSDHDSDERILTRIKQTYDLTSCGFFTHATPTLFNAGTPHNLSSCYLLGTDDSIDSIFNTVKDCAVISKWAGGIGVHVSNIRARGATIKSTGGKADGLVPMLSVFNATARYCNQSGKRNGSIAFYVEPWHADVFEFIELRKNTGAETERTRDLFLALWVPDEFMRRLLEDEWWYLMCPDACPGLAEVHGLEFTKLYNDYVTRGMYLRRVRAKALWQHVITAQLETGTPYVMFKDHVNRKCNQINRGTIRSSNLCAEITEYSDANEYAVCNLASIAVNRFCDECTGCVDHAALHETAKLVTRNLNRIIDVNGYPTPKTELSNMKMRPIGIGVQGLGDLYCMLRMEYDSEQALRLDADLMESIYHGAVEASIELAEELGPYECFEGSPASEGRFQFDLWDVPSDSLSGRYDWETLRVRMKKSGMRNSLLTALMPTASTSQILGNCECFEPFQSNVFKRSTLAGEFLVLNRYLMQDLMRRRLWDDEMRRDLIMHDGSVQDIDRVPDDVKLVYKTVWEIPQRAIIDHAVARGPFVCQSQSMNLFMARPSFQRVSSALIYAWTKGLKTGVYYLRSTAAVEAIKYGVSSSASTTATASNPAASETTTATNTNTTNTAATNTSNTTNTAANACRRDDPHCAMCSA